jgi:16S rRNA (guanine1207-N2)-methyltransferase
MRQNQAEPGDVGRLREDIVFQERLRGREYTFHSTWGLFNPRRVDPGSRLLVETLQVNPGDVCLDMGCGYGPVGLVLASLNAPAEAHLVDKDFVAVEYARRNATLNGLGNARVYLSNAFSHVPGICFDCVASNLPAKAGNEMLALIIHDAHAALRPGGRFYVVTISGLKSYIKRNFLAIFGNYAKIKQGKTHAVAVAVKD